MKILSPKAAVVDKIVASEVNSMRTFVVDRQRLWEALSILIFTFRSLVVQHFSHPVVGLATLSLLPFRFFDKTTYLNSCYGHAP